MEREEWKMEEGEDAMGRKVEVGGGGVDAIKRKEEGRGRCNRKIGGKMRGSKRRRKGGEEEGGG